VSERLLISLRRPISTSLESEYEATWRLLREAAEMAGVHAWRFRSVDRTAARLEFLECAVDRDPLAERSIADALRSLDSLSPAESEVWIGG